MYVNKGVDEVWQMWIPSLLIMYKTKRKTEIEKLFRNENSKNIRKMAEDGLRKSAIY